MHLFYKLSRCFFNLSFKFLYKLKVYGIEHLPKGPAILAPNHTSYWDPPMVGAAVPEELIFLGKEELFDNFFLKSAIKNLNTYPLGSSTRDLESMKLIIRFLKEGQKVVIFPEGERTVDGKLTEIKRGIGMIALRSEAPIVPIYIDGNYEIWPIFQKYPKLSGKATVVIGSPIYVNKFIEMPKKEAQVAISQAVHKALENLKNWVKNGSLGPPP